MTPLMQEMKSDKIRVLWDPWSIDRDVYLAIDRYLGPLNTQCLAVSFLTMNQSVEDRLGVRLEKP